MSASVLVNGYRVRSVVASWLESEASVNCAGVLSRSTTVSADVRMCNQGTLAGTPFVDAVVKECGCKIDWHVKEGESVDNKNTKVATIFGPASEIVSVERLLISILSRASGITTFAKKLKKILLDSSWDGNLRATNLTLGSSLIEEYSMLLAGVASIKSNVVVRHNHTIIAGGINKAIQSIRSKLHPKVNIEVECLTLQDAQEAASSGACIIEFAQMPTKEIACVSAQLKSSYPDVQIQASGSFDESNIKSIATPNINLISTSKLSNGYNCIDFTVTVESNVNGLVPVDVHSNASRDESEKLESSEAPKANCTNEDSSNPPAAKKSRLEDKVAEVTAASTATVASVNASSGGAKHASGTPSRDSATASTAGSTAPSGAVNTNPSKEQPNQQKRTQRNQRNSYTNTNKLLHLQSGVGGGGVSSGGAGSSQLQMGSPSAGNPRFSPYAGSLSRAGGNPSPYQTSGMNPNFPAPPSLFGGGGGQLMSFGAAGGGGVGGGNTNHQQQRLASSMRGGYLDVQQGHRQHGWTGAGGGNQMMMHSGRLQSGVVNCGGCGEINTVGVPFCRRCRVHLR